VRQPRSIWDLQNFSRRCAGDGTRSPDQVLAGCGVRYSWPEPDRNVDRNDVRRSEVREVRLDRLDKPSLQSNGRLLNSTATQPPFVPSTPATRNAISTRADQRRSSPRNRRPGCSRIWSAGRAIAEARLAVADENDLKRLVRHLYKPTAIASPVSDLGSPVHVHRPGPHAHVRCSRGSTCARGDNSRVCTRGSGDFPLGTPPSRSHGERVAALVVALARMPFHPVPTNAMSVRLREKLLPEILIRHRLSLRGPPAST
jgi:hypothetical protein